MIIKKQIAFMFSLIVLLVLGSAAGYVEADKAQSARPGGVSITVPDDVFWDNRFASPGPPDGTINTIVTAGRDVYIGGNFSRIDDLYASQIAKWDGTTWSPLGGGRVDVVTSIAVSGQTLYAGGGFGIAKWDGHNWSELGSGVAGTVNAIAIMGDDIFVGGIIFMAGGQPVNGIARWDGSSWHSLGSGVNGEVRALAVLGNDLYVGGVFGEAGGMPAKAIAKWDGSAWSSLNNSFSNCTTCHVRTIAVSGNDVFVGGRFESVGEVDAIGIARWDGAAWSGLGDIDASEINALTFFDGDLYAGGSGILIDDGPEVTIARWNGSDWSHLGSSILSMSNIYVQALGANSRKLYVAGTFRSAGGVNVSNFAQWDGANWSQPGNPVTRGLDRGVLTLEASQNKIYAGGHFKRAGNITANGVAVWDGGKWSALGSGVNSTVREIEVNGNDVYVAGDFTTAGGLPASFIAKWDGNSWSSLGGGVNSSVYDMAISGNDLYVGGAFTNAGGQNISFIARWDGSAWSALGSGVNGTVNSVAVSGNNVYVAGQFTQAGGMEVNYIARWDGTTWSPLGGGLNGLAFAVAARGNEVFVSGLFNRAGDVETGVLARWDGNQWSPMGSFTGCLSGFCPPLVTVLYATDSQLYAGGTFQSVNGMSANQIAVWDGNNWSTLGSGLYPGFDLPTPVYAIAMSGRDIYVGGEFEEAGGKPSHRIARWNNCAVNLSSASEAFAASGGNGSFLFTNLDACPLTAYSNSDWITLTTDGSGDGDGSVAFTVAPNTTPERRLGTITIASKTFTVIQAPDFIDVSASNPFYTEIGKIAARGITLGCGDPVFCPDQTVTREQMAAFILRALGDFNPPPPVMQRFTDVPPENPFYAFIEQMAIREITQGCGGGNYCPSQPALREHMAAFMIRALHPPGYVPPEPGMQRFLDVPPTNLFYAFIEEMAVRQITLGCGGGNYCPAQPVTRAQMAAFIVRAFDL